MSLSKKILTYCVIVALALISAVSYQLFIFPNHFAPAGINGVCTMIQYLSGVSVGYLSLIINIPLALLVFFKVGRSVAGRSMLYVVSFSVALLLLDHVDLSRFAYETANGTSKILGPLVGGVISGMSYSILLRCSASGGGTDFIAAIVHRKRPDFSFFWVAFSLNVCVAVASYFVYDYQMEPVLLCILYCFMSSTLSERLLKSGRSAIRCEIVTDYPQEISDAIIQQLHHSATLIPAKGMYLGKETSILVCVVNNAQVASLTELIQAYPNTFAVLSSVSQVMGNFKRLDRRGNQERELLDRGDGQVT